MAVQDAYQSLFDPTNTQDWWSQNGPPDPFSNEQQLPTAGGGPITSGHGAELAPPTDPGGAGPGGAGPAAPPAGPTPAPNPTPASNYWGNDVHPVQDPATGLWSVPGGPSGLTIGQLAAGGLATAGFPGQFSQSPFQAPDATTVMNDPGWMFTRDQALGAVERSAAGRGLLGSSGTYTDPSTGLAALGANLANQHYGDVANRQLGIYNTNYGNAWQKYLNDQGIFSSTQDRNFTKNLTYAQA